MSEGTPQKQESPGPPKPADAKTTQTTKHPPAAVKPAAEEKPAKPERRRFILSSSPHIREDESVSKIMFTVTLTLIPAVIGATWIFGMRALNLVLLGMAAAVITEWAVFKLFKMTGSVADGSALLTGLLVSFNIPPGTAWWIPVIGSFFAIAIGKMPFGGLGYNPMNPALLGRA